MRTALSALPLPTTGDRHQRKGPADMPAKRLEPTVRLFDPDKKTRLAYTHSSATDIGKRFAAIRRAQAQAERLADPAAAAAAKETVRRKKAEASSTENPAQLRLVG